jgi:mRNA interferase YafQ
VYTPVYTAQFKRDYKSIFKSGRGIDELDECIRQLIAGKIMPRHLEDHPLKGEWKTFRDCHARGDLVVIYRIDQHTLTLVRAGSHAQLFKNRSR